jgi:Malectin domain
MATGVNAAARARLIFDILARNLFKRNMGATPSLQLQEAEMERVLRSGLFAKAPRLEKFFRYICELHLQGRGEQIKEYSIATEALGRPAEFDPKKDSIVRVEAHRLRKRLEEYYREAGAEHAVRILIPNGQYRPQFIASENSWDTLKQHEPSSAAPAFETVSVVGVDLPAPTSNRIGLSWLRSILLAVVCACIVAVIFLLHGLHIKAAAAPPGKPAVEIWRGDSSLPATVTEFRMLTGYQGPTIRDRQGHAWMPDAFYKGGISTSLTRDRLPDAQPDAQFLRAQRAGQFDYSIPLRQTTYELHLYMIETEYGNGNPKAGGDATRAFQVSVNGSPILKFIDPLAAAGGPNRLYERVLKDITPAADGKLHLAFDPITGPAFLNALEILPSPRGRIHPIRIVAQESPVTDSEGRLWSADEYFSGGTPVCRNSVVENSQDALFHGERYGNFSYRIPVAPGRYRLTLHFAETWFGTPQSNEPALGSRIFNVFVNGVTLLRNYEVLKDAGAPYREVRKVFDNLEPNAQGLLLIEFVPVENYAEVNAIEVVETG